MNWSNNFSNNFSIFPGFPPIDPIRKALSSVSTVKAITSRPGAKTLNSMDRGTKSVESTA